MTDKEKILSSSSSSDSDSDIEVKPKKSKNSKKSQKAARQEKQFSWGWVVPFALLWLALFFGVVIRYANKLPTALTIRTEHLNKDRFIAERAEILLKKYEAIGPKVVGSAANEVVTVNYLLNEFKAIKSVLNTDLFKLEVDVQEVSGAYIHWDMVNMYQGVQNVVVKLSSKISDSSSYLLINTHFDSKPGSPGSGDPGAMVVVMLEVLRVLATSGKSFTHPIVFLFNGAEENPLQASHGFITQHKWAKNCKALFNLDSAGSGNREILFQSSPRNPWLMKYYKKAVVHPYATTLAEELFQLNLIPSDTDFRNFQNFGPVYGLDMAHSYNGYVYHTKHDKANVIPRETLQNTGDNILSLAKAFAEAPELEDPSKYSAGSTVFYDILGQYLVIYTNDQAIELNYGVSIVAVIAIFFSISAMSANSKTTFVGVVSRFILTLLVHLIGLVLGVLLTVGLGTYLDKFGVPLSWFTFKWMVIGLYFCPLIFGLGLPTAILIGAMKKDKLSLSFRVQLVLNSQALVVALLSAAVTYYGIKSAYLLMLATLLYTVSSIFNTLTTLYRRGFAWFYVVLLFQIPAFIYFTYIGYIFFYTLMPMMGRFGPTTNPDLYISGLTALIGILALGFIVPLVNLFRKSKRALGFCLVLAAVFVGIAFSPYGFPFRPATNVERFNVLHARRVFHEVDGSVSKNESGYYFDPQDRKGFTAVSTVFDTKKLVPMADQCSQYMVCGLPVFNHRWNRARALAQWLPSGDVELPSTPKLTLVSKKVDKDFLTVRYDFKLDGPPHMGIFLGPLKGANITSWTFLNTWLEKKTPPPYFIYFSKGKDQSTLKFFVTFEKTNETLLEPSVELGIAGHFVSGEHDRGAANTAFLKSFPPYTFVMEWPSSYERWYY